jgi:predicted Zn-dependent protease
MDASLCFLYLHEFGHHVLHHVGNTESLAISRAQEAAADAWAISTAFEARFNLAAASPAFNFVAGLGGGSLEDEVKQTHPLGIRRVVSMLTEARDIMARNSDPHVADLDRTIAEIRKRIPVR